MGADDDRILRKIKACLALAKSANPNEAATALRQAKKMMESYGFTESDVELADIAETSRTTGSSSKKIPSYLNGLITLIADVFGVRPVILQRLRINHVTFIGVETSVDIAGYAFDVLRRQLTKARNAHFKKRRGHRINRIRKADSYAIGWVIAVRGKAEALTINERTRSLVELYVGKHYPSLVTLPQRNAAVDLRSANEGFNDGLDATLNAGLTVGARVSALTHNVTSGGRP